MIKLCHHQHIFPFDIFIFYGKCNFHENKNIEKKINVCLYVEDFMSLYYDYIGLRLGVFWMMYRPTQNTSAP